MHVYSYILQTVYTSQLSVNVPTESLIDVLNKYPAMIDAADYSTYLDFKHESYCRSHIERNQFSRFRRKANLVTDHTGFHRF